MIWTSYGDEDDEEVEEEDLYVMLMNGGMRHKNEQFFSLSLCNLTCSIIYLPKLYPICDDPIYAGIRPNEDDADEISAGPM